jgi:hypothetical protein
LALFFVFSLKLQVLSDGIRDRSVKKGELFEEDKSLHAQLNKHKTATDGALQRFLTASAAAEASRKQFHFAQQDASIPPKKLKVACVFFFVCFFV